MAIRIKSQWFKDGPAKTPEQNGSALAFIAWRVAQNTLKQMRSAHFDIDVGPQYFAFTRELLVFLLQVGDRMAFDRLDGAQRAAFVAAMVRRVAEVLQENEDLYLGVPAANDATHFDTFIDMFNELADHYAEFGYSALEGPDFAFVRYLGHRVERIMPAKDQRWVIEQLMASEVPQAVQMLKKGFDGIFSTEPRPRTSRRASTGD